MADVTLKFSDIRNLSLNERGLFRLNPEQCGWKNPQTQKMQSLFFRDLLERPEVSQVSARNFLVKAVTRKKIYRFDGFQKPDILRLEKLLAEHVFHREKIREAVPLCADAVLAVADAKAGNSTSTSASTSSAGGTTTSKKVQGLTSRSLAARGATWGDLELLGEETQEYCMRNECEESILDFAALDVIQVTNPSRHEMHIELADPFLDDEGAPESNSAGAGGEQLTEIRFFVDPGTSLGPTPGEQDAGPEEGDSGGVLTAGAAPASAKSKRGRKGKRGNNMGAAEQPNDPGAGAAEEQELTNAERMKQALMQQLDLDVDNSECICEVSDLKWAIPALRGALKFHAGHFSLHGKSSDFVIRYQQLSKLFVLQGLRNDMHIVLQLSTPVRHGSQEHYFLCMQSEALSRPTPDGIEISNVKEEELHKHGLAATPADLLARLQQQQPPQAAAAAPILLYDWIARVFRLLCDVQLIMMHDRFASARGGKCVLCNYKNNSGMLFPLKKALLFIHKPVLHVLYTRIHAVQVQRGTEMTSANRFFDLSVLTKDNTYEFRQVPKEELKPLLALLKTMGVKVPVIEEKKIQPQMKMHPGVDDEEDNDSEFVPDEDHESDVDMGSSGDEADDHAEHQSKKQRMK
eukprot:g4416.t1